MLVRDMFDKDINRNINGVIKVEQGDEATVEQELEEYVVTRELSRHFATFFEAYNRAIDIPTDDTGVWISGFFGSGKSHFLKMLSYLLSNKEVAGRHAVDYFDGKISDELVYSQMRRAASVTTESILFNIDNVAAQWKSGATAETALLRAFERVFYDHLGFYGTELKLAKLEKAIDGEGKTQLFRDTFEEINGKPWLQRRKNWDMFEDDIVDTLREALGWSEEAAQHWFDGTIDDVLAPDAFIEEVREYTEKRAAECGGNFRLLFMVDEVGQFIGTDSTLMLNLQTLVEGFGTECAGRVWVMTTSQEAIDEVATIVNNDFSRILGRFKTRLSLSSSSVDEVIKKRILEKTGQAKSLLEGEYGRQGAVLRNLYSFEKAVSDLVGYSGPSDFVASYPFVNYQFKLLPGVLTEVRKHGISAQHMATGERSMLAGFQEALQKVQDRGDGSVVPFWRFYDALAKDFEHGIIQVVDRAGRAAEEGRGLEPQDVEVLKLLYLILYVDAQVRPTLGNVSIMMVDDISADMVSVRASVQESLSRLEHENYVSRNGDEYKFLTDEEQDIAREIANTQPDPAQVTGDIQKIVFESIYPAKKFHYGANDYPFDGFVDGAAYQRAVGGMHLEFATVASDLAQLSDAELNLRSLGKAIVVLADDGDYYGSLDRAARIEKFVKTKNVQQLPPSVQNIIKGRNMEARRCREEARGLIGKAILSGRCSVNGAIVDVPAANAKGKIEVVLTELVQAVYTKAGLIDDPIQTNADLLSILQGTRQQGLGEGAGGGGNSRAAKDMEMYLEAQAKTYQPTSLGDIQRRYAQVPYGWRAIDTAAVVASLVASQRATVSVDGAVLPATDKKLLDTLTKQSAWDGATVKKRRAANANLVREARLFLKDFRGSGIIPEDEDGLVAEIKETLRSEHDRANGLLHTQYAHAPYPGKDVVESGAYAMGQVLGTKGDNEAFLKALSDEQDRLYDYSEAMQDGLNGFFGTQKPIFDRALATIDAMKAERAYIDSSREAVAALDEMKKIVGMPEPYRRIKDLAGLMGTVESEHKKVVSKKQNDVIDHIDALKKEVREYASEQENGLKAASVVLSKMDTRALELRDQAHRAATATQLDAMTVQLNAYRSQLLAQIDRAVEQWTPPTPVGPIPTHEPPATPKPPKTSRTVSSSDLCPPKRIMSQADIDAYVESIRAKLSVALEDVDVVRVN